MAKETLKPIGFAARSRIIKSLEDRWQERAARLLAHLYANAMSPPEAREMTAGKIKSAQIVLSKFIPDLSSQQLTIEREEPLDADQIQARIQALIAERPELLELIQKKSAAEGAEIIVVDKTEEDDQEGL